MRSYQDYLNGSMARTPEAIVPQFPPQGMPLAMPQQASPIATGYQRFLPQSMPRMGGMMQGGVRGAVPQGFQFPQQPRRRPMTPMNPYQRYLPYRPMTAKLPPGYAF